MADPKLNESRKENKTMSLALFSGWNNEEKVSAACGTACGAGDKPAEKPAACGAGDAPAACGAGDKPTEAPAACGASDK